jgi:hypothetical protein
MVDDPHQESEQHTQKQTGDDRKIKGPVAALVRNVAGQAPKTEWKPAAEYQKSTGDQKHDADGQQEFAEFTRGVHGKARVPFYLNPMLAIVQRSEIPGVARPDLDQI